ncbi:hypothetical protein BC830DRAFT_565871 [Chytriomyces sp. MP71]|nr:hypothetical protein BC830DRAFT_565871 [Chytriomyces sp. MP71]
MDFGGTGGSLFVPNATARACRSRACNASRPVSSDVARAARMPLACPSVASATGSFEGEMREASCATETAKLLLLVTVVVALARWVRAEAGVAGLCIDEEVESDPFDRVDDADIDSPTTMCVLDALASIGLVELKPDELGGTADVAGRRLASLPPRTE